MDIVVLVKRVPDMAEVEVTIDRTRKDIRKDDLVFDINEWDNCALEEAVQLREKHGGTVTAITLGPEESEDVLRRCLALGADNALRLHDPGFAGGDAFTTATVLAAALAKMPFDLVLTGVMASDDGDGQVGGVVAQLLGIPHSTLVTAVETDGRSARVRRELEGGLEESVELRMPALLTVQTGINEPRYVPIAGIRRAARRDIPVQGLAELGLAATQVGTAGARAEVEEVFLPETGQRGEMLEGRTEEIVESLVRIFARRGWLG
jgi:electron transfer flavoprotein beta subunit